MNVDKKEIKKFDDISYSWWDPEGPFKPLHMLNPVRTDFIKNRIDLKDKTLIDVGCGGGILSEKLRRLGANVTGIDASKSSIDIAKDHAKKSRLEINYKCMTTSKLLEIKEQKTLNKFDLVIASEVIEHVNDKITFLSDISNLCRPGGLVVFTTINNSFLGKLFFNKSNNF